MIHELESPFVRATVSTTAAMLIEAEFTLGSRQVRPLAIAPWVGTESLEGEPGHVRVLGGDFVALPFGSVGGPARPTAGWELATGLAAPEPAHGPAADADWTVTEATATSITLELHYPADHAVERVERTVSIRHNDTALDFSCTIHVRRPTSIAIGLHPILALPVEPGALTIHARFERGYTYPGDVEPVVSIIEPGATFDALDLVPGLDGETVDLSALPFANPIEEVVLLAGATSPVRILRHDDDYAVELAWDDALVPNVQLWASDRALDGEPWNRRYRGLGVEPIAAAFDLPDSVSTGDNPISLDGFATSIRLDPAHAKTVRHSLRVSTGATP